MKGNNATGMSAEMAAQPRDFYNQQRPLNDDMKKQQ